MKHIAPLIVLLVYMPLALADPSASGETNANTFKHSPLERHLVFYSSFDDTTDVNLFGWPNDAGWIYTAESTQRKTVLVMNRCPEVSIAKDEGQLGDCLRFANKTEKVLFYQASPSLLEPRGDWNGAVTFWLKPKSKQIGPNGCYPLQLTDGDWRHGGLFIRIPGNDPSTLVLGAISSTKAVRGKSPRLKDIADSQRSLVSAKGVLADDRWTMVSIAFAGVNPAGTEESVARLYTDGKLAGEIRRPLHVKWMDPAIPEAERDAVIFLGIGYVGDMDELRVYDSPQSAPDLEHPCGFAADAPVAEHDNKGKETEPKTARDYYERGLKRERNGQVDAAIADHEKAGELQPQLFDAHFTRSALLADRRDYQNAIEALSASLNARPNDYSALFNRGLYHQYLGKYDEAIADFSAALSEDADFSHQVSSPEQCRAAAYHYRGRVYQWFKKDDLKAIADYSAALRLDPDIRMVLYRRGQAHHRVKEYAKAHADFEQAIEQQPDYPNLLNSWAWQLATCPDAKFRNGALAVKLVLKTGYLDTLAAAYAETGKFDDAVATQRSAIAQLDRQKQPTTPAAIEQRRELRREMLSRLASYQAQQPYRE